MPSLVKRLRGRILDNDVSLNTLMGKLDFTDSQLEGYILDALADINETEPATIYTLEQFPKSGLLLQGALVMMLRAKGLLHLRNQVSYSDAGFSLNLDDKSPMYAQWLSQEITYYLQERKEFKRAQVPRFFGMYSPMGWYP